MAASPSDADDDRGGRFARIFNGPNTLGNSRRFWGGFGVVSALLLAFPIYMLPFAVSNMAKYMTIALLSLSLAIVWGYAGILSFGQVAFFGIAGYTFGVVSINVGGALGTTLGFGAGILLGALTAFVLGYFMFYGGVSDVYVTILTLVVALVLKTFMDQTAGDEWAIGDAALGGFNGMPGIPDLAFGVGETALVLDDTVLFYAVAVILLVTYLGLRALVNSDYGRIMVAVREDEARTEMFGYNVKRVKLTVFTFGGALAGLGGVLYTTWGSYIDPTVFGITFASLPVIYVAVGGRHTLVGPLVATILLQRLATFLSINVGEYAFIVNGALLLLIVLALPEGLLVGVRDAIRWLGTRRTESEDGPADSPQEVPE